MTGIAEDYVWIAQSFPPAIRAIERDLFQDMVCKLVIAGIPTVIINRVQGPIVVTWKALRVAN